MSLVNPSIRRITMRNADRPLENLARSSLGLLVLHGESGLGFASSFGYGSSGQRNRIRSAPEKVMAQ